MIHDDLRWYFREASAACGLRSSHSIIEYTLQLGCIVSGSPRMSDDSITDRMLDAWKRARAIHARLACVGERAERILEAHFGCAESVKDLGLDLLILTPSAEKSFEIASKIVKTSAARRARGGLSARAWVLWLAAHHGESERFEAILADGRRMLAMALEAYEGRMAA